MHNATQNTISLTLFLLLIGTALYGQVTAQQLESTVDELYAELSETTPGAAVLVTKDGKTLLNKGYGMANLEYNVPVSSTTVFDMASVAKQFTGYAIAQLVTEGKVSLEDDVRKYIPELPDFGTTITIDHLVHHTSGLRDWTSTLPLAGWSFKELIPLDQILRMIYRQQGLNFIPGEEYAYCNSAYNLLAEVIQRVTGRKFQDWTKAHIFEPLAMNSTLFLNDPTQLVSGRADAYYKTKGNYYQNPNLTTAMGSSSLLSTTEDLAKWTTFLLQPKGDKKQIVDQMLQRGKLNNGEELTYAFGIDVDTFNGTPWIGHSGGWQSFSTFVVVLPEHDLSIAVLRNEWGSPTRAAKTIAALFVPGDKAAVSKDTPEANNTQPTHQSLQPKALDAYKGMYKLGPGWFVDITRQGDQLYTQATNEDNFPMITVHDGLFQIEAYGNRTMAFHRDAEGKVVSMTYNGLDCEYVGRFYSEELEAVYLVKLEDGQLSMNHFRKGRIDLIPCWGDEFGTGRGFLKGVEFSRGEDGTVNGLYVSNYRARRQWLSKLE